MDAIDRLYEALCGEAKRLGRPSGTRWLPLLGYEPRYEISEYGDVCRINRMTGEIVCSCAKTKNPSGYYIASLNGGDKKRTRLVHRLVAKTFIPNPEKKEQVNHKDGNKDNYHVGNLEWTTPKENSAHAWATGLMNPIGLPGEKNGRAKLKEEDVRQIRQKLALGLSTKTVARQYGVAFQLIHRIGKREAWKCVL